MVVFTCNACGSSLKKSQVEKHYQSECSRCEVLSCMDCGQDFYGDDYAKHTKCVSEAEKYQGSLFKEGAKAGGAGKGEQKQQEWLQRVQDLVAGGAKVKPRISSLLERITPYPNIPRKKSKFENFVKNSINVRDQPTLSELWELFSTAIKPKPPEEKSETTVPTASECETSDSLPQPKKEKKKKRKSTEDKDEQQSVSATEPEPGQSALKTKKKKHKHEKEAESSPAVETEGLAIATMSDGVVAQKTKKKKKKRKHSTELLSKQETEEDDFTAETPVEETMNESMKEDCTELAPPPKKKKKRSKPLENGSLVSIDKDGGSGCGVGPMEVAVEYINGCHPLGNRENCVTDAQDECAKKKISKKCKSEQETGLRVEVTVGEEEGVKKKSKRHKKHKH